MRLKTKTPKVVKKEPSPGTDPEICTSFTDKFRCTLYTTFPKKQESFDLRNKCQYLEEVHRKIFPCRLIFQHDFLTMTLPFRGYHREEYETQMEKLFKILTEIEAKYDVRFVGTVHGDDELPKFKNSLKVKPPKMSSLKIRVKSLAMKKKTKR